MPLDPNDIYHNGKWYSRRGDALSESTGLLGGSIPPGVSWASDSILGIDIYAKGFAKTPNIFFDPSASTSLNRGTYNNPYNSLATLQLAVKGRMPGAVVGFKRGTVTRSNLFTGSGPYGLTGYMFNPAVSGDDSNPITFCPYGDAEALPILDSYWPLAAWTVEDSTDPANVVWKINITGGTRPLHSTDGGLTYTPYWELTANNTATLKAAGRGFCYYSANFIYIIPYDNANPNSGVLYVNGAQHVFGHVSPNHAQSGNVTVAGLNLRGGRAHTALFVPAVTGAAWGGSNTMKNIVFVGNNVLTGNFPNNSTSDVGNGVTIQGVYSDTAVANYLPVQRITGCYMAGNYIANTKHNAVEVWCLDGAIIERNIIPDCFDFAIELWAANNNCHIRYNSAYYSDSNLSVSASDLLYKSAFINEGIDGTGNNGAGHRDSSQNVNNWFYQNFIKTNGGTSITNNRGECHWINNTIVSRDIGGPTGAIGALGNDSLLASTSSPVGGASEALNICSGKFINNLVIKSYGRTNPTVTGYFIYSNTKGSGWNTGVTAANNVYAYQRAAGSAILYWNGAAQTSVAAFNTASSNRETGSTLVSSTGWAAFIASLDSDFRPLTGNTAKDFGTATGLPFGALEATSGIGVPAWDSFGTPMPAATPDCGWAQG